MQQSVDTNKKQVKKKKKSWISTLILVVILLAGVGIMAYPTVSDWWNSMHSTRAIANYTAVVDAASREEKERILNAAKEYNDRRPLGVHLSLSDAEMSEYESLLDLTGTGIMGYIQIPAINVDMPVYHTVEDSVLQVAAGHIPGSSLPVGGQSAHSIISGHRGLPSARLFTDLDKLVEGDVFTITVLDETYTYMIDQIRIVLPEETEELAVERDRDYCTLVTCTPYGINTHRILIRGARVENTGEVLNIPADATKVPSYLVIPAVAVPMLFLLLLILLILYGRKPAHVTLWDVQGMYRSRQDMSAKDEDDKQRAGIKSNRRGD